MSMLGRFRKNGGFYQLLTLIESSDPFKQKTLLHLVGAEDPGWANLIKTKILTLNRILTWPNEVLMEITSQVPDRIFVAAYYSLDEANRNKWMLSIPTFKRREIEQLILSMKPTPIEMQAAHSKIILTVRELVEQDKIHFAQVDPTLLLDQRLAS